MKEDNSSKNFRYAGESIEIVSSNPDEYIVPECLEACRSFWDKNIFTASCSNRDEKKNKDGKVLKYIMVSNLSEENLKKFKQLAQEYPHNYTSIERYQQTYYVIIIESTDNEQDRDSDSKAFLDLVSPFQMQDCLEGFVSLKDYYIQNLTGGFYPSKTVSIPDSEQELIDAVKKYLNAFGKLDLLDLDRKVVYDSMFYKKAHDRYLEYLRTNPPTNPDPHEL